MICLVGWVDLANHVPFDIGRWLGYWSRALLWVVTVRVGCEPAGARVVYKCGGGKLTGAWYHVPAVRSEGAQLSYKRISIKQVDFLRTQQKMKISSLYLYF